MRAGARRPLAAPLLAAALVLLAAGLNGCTSPDVTNTLTVFAAASLNEALTELAPAFDDGRTEVICNFAGSNTLRDQILHGASADVFLSAHPIHMDAVEASGLLITHTRVDILSNRLVLVARPDAPDVHFLTDPLRPNRDRPTGCGTRRDLRHGGPHVPGDR